MHNSHFLHQQRPLQYIQRGFFLLCHNVVNPSLIHLSPFCWVCIFLQKIRGEWRGASKLDSDTHPSLTSPSLSSHPPPALTPQGVIPLGGCMVEEGSSGPQKYTIKITHNNFKVRLCCTARSVQLVILPPHTHAHTGWDLGGIGQPGRVHKMGACLEICWKSVSITVI